ncbi:glycosyltransferase [Cellulomonas composti]|uniref:Glycosyl transferase n=1 Tax=Cellulomonas composti TaxID=266130 RepID=A0A511JAE4_9CELL|nr:glycosyltransferase family 2 protein [Cellulomonas composti]GEL94971.1 hypothetical protein CCO02nite_16290 [Cellulomonas composti]
MSAPIPAHAAVLVVSHRSSDLLARHLAATVDGLDADVVVVDNSPDDDERSATVALGASRGWHVVESPNDGFGAGVNLAARHALARGARSLLMVNPDLSLSSSTAAALLADVRARPDTLVAPVVLRADGSTWFSGGTLDLGLGRTRATGTAGDDDVAWLSGACLAVSDDAWQLLAGFDERYFLYWEDVDLSWRARAAGLRLAVRRDLTTMHEVGGTQEHAGSRRRSDMYYEQNCRNRLMFAAHHLDGAGRRRWSRHSIGWGRAVVLRGGRRQLLRGPGPLLAVTRGTLSGLRYARRRRPAWPLDATGATGAARAATGEVG